MSGAKAEDFRIGSPIRLSLFLEDDGKASDFGFMLALTQSMKEIPPSLKKAT